MNYFFECTIKHQVSCDDNKEKKFKYLVEAESYTEAEKACYTIMEDLGMFNFSIESIVKTDVNELFVDNRDDDSNFYSIKLATSRKDEDTGRDIIVNKYHYVVVGNDIVPVVRYCKNLFSTDDVIIIQAKRTNITEYYSRDDIRDMANHDVHIRSNMNISDDI